MNRLKQELHNRGITFDDADYTGYRPYEAEEQLIAVCNGFIITGYFSNVLEPHFKLYDRNFNHIGIQSSEKPETFFGEKCCNPWSVGVVGIEDDEVETP